MDSARHARLNRLRWHCRRALLELDLVFQRFWARRGADIDDETEATLRRLLAMEDHDLWALVSGKASADDDTMKRLLEELRSVPDADRMTLQGTCNSTTQYCKQPMEN